jgi:hypothetical protein
MAGFLMDSEASCIYYKTVPGTTYPITLSDHCSPNLNGSPSLRAHAASILKQTAMPVNILRLGGFSKRDFVNFSTRGPFGPNRHLAICNFERSIASPPAALPPLMPPKRSKGQDFVSVQFYRPDRQQDHRRDVSSECPISALNTAITADLNQIQQYGNPDS